MSKVSNYFIFVDDEERDYEEFFRGRCVNIKEIKQSQLPKQIQMFDSFYDEAIGGNFLYKRVFEIIGISLDEIKFNAALIPIKGAICSDFSDEIYAQLISACDKVELFEEKVGDMLSSCYALKTIIFDGVEGDGCDDFENAIDTLERGIDDATCYEDNPKEHLLTALEENEFLLWDI